MADLHDAQNDAQTQPRLLSAWCTRPYRNLIFNIEQQGAATQGLLPPTVAAYILGRKF